MANNKTKRLTQYLNSDEEELNCYDFSKIEQFISELREVLLFDFEEAGTSPLAEQHFLLSLTALETAKRYMKIAEFHQMKRE